MIKIVGIRAVAGVLSFLLFLFAGLQYNDPDSALWGLIYGASAVLPLLIVFGRYSERGFWLCLGLCAAGLAVSVQGAFTWLVSYADTQFLIQDMAPDKPYIEEAREFLGTAIALGVLLASQRLRVTIG